MQKYIDIQHDVTICKNYQVYVDKFKKKLEEYEKNSLPCTRNIIRCR